MKPEYDFSKGERGKFYSPNAEFRFPIYLAPDVEAGVALAAAQKNVDVQDLVNEWLRANMEALQTQS